MSGSTFHKTGEFAAPRQTTRQTTELICSFEGSVQERCVSPGIWCSMRFDTATFIGKIIACLTFGMILFSAQTSGAASMACPVMLYGGKLDRGAVSLNFMNRGKVPIRQLGLYCTSLQGHNRRRFECHAEAGVFFPGTPYTLSFDYPDKTSRLIEVSVKNAVLDGYMWTSTHDQPCRPLKVFKR
jgi:hypothetical protein